MTRARATALAAATALLCLPGCGGEESGFASIPEREPRSAGPLRSDVRIDMREIEFSPELVRVRRGGQVTWVNRDGVAHTVTDGNRIYNEFDSGDVEPGARYRRSFGEPGEISYRCTIHASMEGTLRVEE